MLRPVFADPKTDFTFKRIFGSEEHQHVLIAFLNDMLVEALCRALRIDRTEDRRRHLSTLDMTGLQALLAQLETHGRWK